MFIKLRSRPSIALVLPVLALSIGGATNGSPLTFNLSGTFGQAYAGPLNNGTFKGFYTLATLPLTPPNTGSSYEYLTNYDVVLTKGSTTVEFKPGFNGSGGYFSSVYETSSGGDFLQFNDSSNDTFDLYFTSGFNGIGNVITTTSKGYVSAVSVGGSANSNYSNVSSGVSFAPEPATDLTFGIALVGLALYGRRRRVASRQV